MLAQSQNPKWCKENENDEINFNDCFVHNLAASFIPPVKPILLADLLKRKTISVKSAMFDKPVMY